MWRKTANAFVAREHRDLNTLNDIRECRQDAENSQFSHELAATKRRCFL